MKHCLIVIDMQKGIFELKRAVYRSKALIEAVQRSLRFARDHDIDIVFSLHENHTYLKPGTVGQQIVEGISIHESDTVIRKTKPDVFFDTNLKDILKKKQVSTVFVAGLISNGCVRCACQSAIDLGFQVVLIQDAHSTFYKNAQQIIESINCEMKKAGAGIYSSDELSEDMLI